MQMQVVEAFSKSSRIDPGEVEICDQWNGGMGEREEERGDGEDRGAESERRGTLTDILREDRGYLPD